jgi:dsRNA-specific ribonuclease
VTSKSLSLKLFKNKNVDHQDDDEVEVDFSLVGEKFVKYFADVMESLIGGIFMDSGDFDKT